MTDKKDKLKTPLFDALFPKRQAFIVHYLDRFNSKEAAIKSGYAKASAAEMGKTLLDDQEVQEAITEVLSVNARVMDKAKSSVIQRLYVQTMVSYEDLCKWDKGKDKFVQKLPEEVEERYRCCMSYITLTREGKVLFSVGHQLAAAKLLQSYSLWDKHSPDLLPAVSFNFNGLKSEPYEHKK